MSDGIGIDRLRHSPLAPVTSARAVDRTLPTRVGSAVLLGLLLLAYLWDGPPVVVFGHLALLADTAKTASTISNAGSDTPRQACVILLFAAVAGIGVATRGARFLGSVPRAFVPLLGWCWLSVAWAIEPSIAVRRIGLTTILFLTVAYCVELLSYRRVIDILVAAIVVVLAVDWFAIGAFPLAIHQPIEDESLLAGAWRGMHNHKNEAGSFCAIAFIVLVHEGARVRSHLVAPALALLALVFLYFTQSKTSGSFVLVALLVGACSHVAYRNPRLRLGLGVLAVTALVLALPFLDAITAYVMGALDDPAALTGRSQIWPLLFDYAAGHPLLGAGYGSFWAIGDASPIFAYGTGWVARIDHSHNGYIELLIQVGFVGLALALLALVVLPFRALFGLPLTPPASRSLICSILAFGCLHDLLETSLLNRAHSTWVVMLVMYCLLAKATPIASRGA